MNHEKKVFVSIIIVNYRTKILTENCIKSISSEMAVSEYPYEIIVVDNNSDDGSYEYLLRLSTQNIKIIRSEKNGGFGYGNNLGVQHARGKYLFFLNSDTILYFDIISEMCKLMDMMPEIGVMSCLMDDEEHIPLRVIHSYENLKSVFFQTIVKPLLPRSVYRKWRTRKCLSQDGQLFVEGGWVSGAAMMIPHNLFLQSGGWNEEFFMYMEDEELCYRIQQLGKKIVVYQKLGLQHLVGRSGGSAFSVYQRYKSKFLYFRMTKHFGQWIIKHLLYLQAKRYMRYLSHSERKCVLKKLKEVEK